MKFLVDNALSPKLSNHLNENGYDALHVRQEDMHRAEDESIFEYAESHNFIIISADTDFSLLLSQRQSTSPSLILFCGETTHHPRKQADLLIGHLAELKEELMSGCVASIYSTRIRVRGLPIFGKHK